MTLKDICTSLELSKKLAEAGVSQEDGIAYWFPYVVLEDDPDSINRAEIKVTDKKHWRVDLAEETYKSKVGKMVLGNAIKERTTYRAFTFNELWKMLPKEIETNGKKYHLNLIDRAIGYVEYPHKKDSIWLWGFQMTEKYKNALQEAAGKLLLWCIENGYCDPKEG